MIAMMSNRQNYFQSCVHVPQQQTSTCSLQDMRHYTMIDAI